MKTKNKSSGNIVIPHVEILIHKYNVLYLESLEMYF